MLVMRLDVLVLLQGLPAHDGAADGVDHSRVGVLEVVVEVEVVAEPRGAGGPVVVVVGRGLLLLPVPAHGLLPAEAAVPVK